MPKDIIKETKNNKPAQESQGISAEIDVADRSKTQPRMLKGIVVSAKMQKTVVVAVNKFIKHKKYHKRYTVTKRYKAHDSEGQYKVNDKVIIKEVSPISKEKHWQVVKKY